MTVTYKPILRAGVWIRSEYLSDDGELLAVRFTLARTVWTRWQLAKALLSVLF